jgi:hypothetical protein
MLGVSASRSSAASPGLLQPGRLGACQRRPVAGSKTPGLPTTVWTIRLQRTPASATTARACAAVVRTTLSALRARLRASLRPTIVPARSATATRIQARPMSIPTT